MVTIAMGGLGEATAAMGVLILWLAGLALLGISLLAAVSRRRLLIAPCILLNIIAGLGVASLLLFEYQQPAVTDAENWEDPDNVMWVAREQRAMIFDLACCLLGLMALGAAFVFPSEWPSGDERDHGNRPASA